jgi:secreted trypsin-like serine protease
MPAHKSIRGLLWLTLVAALVAAIVMSFFVFVQRGEATQVANEHSYEPKIIGGTTVATRKYSFVAALLITNRGHTAFQQQFCGGSLIDRDSVLTAAHCVSGTRGLPVAPGPLRITVGRTVLNSDQGQKRRVSRIFIHPRYNGDTVTYDAAVLKLSSPVSAIAPVELATAAQDYLEEPGRKATVAGWGSTSALPPGSFPDRMREVQVPIVSDTQAQQTLHEEFVPRLMVAAGRTGKGPCVGDSGGPMFARVSGKYTQIGITSFGPAVCTAGSPTVYTEVNAPSIRGFVTNAASR